MSPITTTVTATVFADQRAVFGLIVPMDLTTMFTGYGVLPAVISTKARTGGWNVIGQTRSLCFSDGSSAQEQLTGYDYGHRMSYKVTEFTGAIHYLACTAAGTWWFEEDESGHTMLRWQYAFSPRSLWSIPLLWLLTKTLWRRYMLDALSRAVAQLPQRSLLQPSSSYPV